jgi:2-phosphoglycolate phosphatase
VRSPSFPSAVLFDLDGTLLDTAPDMAAALNVLRTLEGLSPLPFDAIRPHVSHGAARLIRIGFDCESGERFEALRLRFLDLYRRDLAVETRPFEGIEAVLEVLERRGIAWGVVTNKPGWLTNPLMSALGLGERAGCVVSGDTLPERKPHPMPLLHAAKLLASEPRDCIYVGDAKRDIEAGRAAGMKTLVAAFGYLSNEDDPGGWSADAILRRPVELLGELGLVEASES